MHWNYDNNDLLIRAFKLANSEHLIKSLLLDLLTEGEMKLCVRRLRAAALILDCAPYSHIQSATGLSSTTIARISKQLINKRGGFQEILGKMNPHGRRYSD